ncbi:MAG TPA: hypothetical protein VGW10_17015 [Solirubrobacteraceae bacterium]|nr:hypothetical protein [Solirubrobacteraceae bacterium]
MRFIVRPLLAAAAAAIVLSGTAAAHELFDHTAPSLTPRPAPTTMGASMGPATAQWEFVTSIATGNPHTDLDFFRRNGNTYATVGTLGVAPNGGGQTIVQLTDGDEVRPRFVSQAPTASCIANEAAALGLQHDVEVSPKGGQILNTFNPYAPQGDAQVIVDATDANGRCHDQGAFGGVSGQGQTVVRDKQGGLEIIDVNDPSNPREIGLTSHIGEAHTVNVDPKRPHIAYAVTSDSTAVNAQGVRANEVEGSTSRALDGFEVVDMSTCINFPTGTSITEKRARCRPQVFRYRWSSVAMSRGTTGGAIYGCHELEVYPDDRLTCGSGQALMVFDMSGAFDDRGTPDDYTDDRLRGTPLPCTVRETASQAFPTGAMVTDCVDGAGEGTDDLIVSKWVAAGAPSLDGVRHIGNAFHMGRNGPRPSTEDIDFDHEAELSQSGNLLIATDERGGGVAPPGASCAQGNPSLLATSNGGVHFYRVDRLFKETPQVRNAEGELDPDASAEAADASYARTPEGGKAIYRAPVRTGGQAIICTAHVFQQIPGQNRIFMGWYSQGTQVLDFTENPDGTVSVQEVGYFIPQNANQWTSAIFKAQENPNGTFTYWGAATDFNIGESGRNSIDIYRVTLPAPPLPADGPGVLPARLKGKEVRDPLTGQTVVAGTQAGGPRCVHVQTIRSASVRRQGRRLGFAFTADAPVTIDLYQYARGGRVTGERLIKRFADVRGTVRWNGRASSGARLTDGHYVVRFAARTPAGTIYERRLPLVRRNGRFSRVPGYERVDSCGLLRRFKLFRPVFGGRTARPLTIGFRLGGDARASIVVRRTGGRVVKRFAEQGYRGGLVHRKRINVRLARRLAKGPYTVTLIVRDGPRTITSSLRATRV